MPFFKLSFLLLVKYCICAPLLSFLATFLMILQPQVWMKHSRAVAALLTLHYGVVRIFEVFSVVAPLDQFGAESAAGVISKLIPLPVFFIEF